MLERFQFADIRMDDVREALFDTPPSQQTTVVETVVRRGLRRGRSSRWRSACRPAPDSGGRDDQIGRDSRLSRMAWRCFRYCRYRTWHHLPELQAQRGATVAFLAKQTIKGTDYAISVVGEAPLYRPAGRTVAVPSRFLFKLLPHDRGT